MAPTSTAIPPDAAFTPTGIVNQLRALAPSEIRSPVGVRAVRRAIHRGELRAAFIGNRNVIRWSDSLAWLEEQRAPIQRVPTRNERVEADVREAIRRESTGKR